MGCWEKFINWLSLSNIPNSEQSIMRDLITIGIAEKE
jgi:hypothetical protein